MTQWGPNNPVGAKQPIRKRIRKKKRIIITPYSLTRVFPLPGKIRNRDAGKGKGTDGLPSRKKRKKVPRKKKRMPSARRRSRR